MKRTSLVSKLGTLLVLGGLAYLGFYVYGLVMGVFAIDDRIGIVFTVIGAAIVAALGLYVMREGRRGQSAPDAEDEELTKAARRQREVRGF